MLQAFRAPWVAVIWVLSGLFNAALAQVSVKDSAIAMVMVRPHIGIQVPGGDLARRFGTNQSIGLSTVYKWKNGWCIQADASFIFGSKVNEPGLFRGLTTSEGTIIGSDGLYGDIRVFERGYSITLGLGKLFPVKKPNPNCGFLVEAGAGFLQHKIKIDDKKNAVPSLRGDYLKGYDRLCNGIALRQFVGYSHVGNRRLVNFFFGLETIQAFTSSRRDINFSTMKADDELRFDLLFGLRAGWIIALFREAPDPFYTY